MTDTPTLDDRAISEVLGFVFVFALILASVSLVSVVGFSDLDDAQAFEQSNNAERAFDVVADNMDDVLLRGAPSRATEIKLTDASLTVAEPITINITATDSSGTVDPLKSNATYDPRPIVYEGQSDTQIVYSAGAVFRDQREGGRIVRDPPFVLEDDRIHLPVALTQSQSVRSIGGGTVRLRAVTAERGLDIFKTGTPYDTIEINITSPRYQLWETYLSEQPAIDNCTTDSDTQSVTCDLDAGGDPEQVSVQVTRINVDFEE